MKNISSIHLIVFVAFVWFEEVIYYATAEVATQRSSRKHSKVLEKYSQFEKWDKLLYSEAKHCGLRSRTKQILDILDHVN